MTADATLIYCVLDQTILAMKHGRQSVPVAQWARPLYLMG